MSNSVDRGISISQLLSILVAGILFGAGLTLSTMVQPESVLQFLNLNDLGLLLVLGCATGLTMLVYQLAPKAMKRPLFALSFSGRPVQLLKKTLVGAVLFGIGWGISGVCPAPAVAGLGTGNWPLLWVVGAMFAGAYVQGRWFSS